MPKRQINDPGWDDLFEAAGRKYNVDPLLLKSIMLTETGDNTAPEKRILDKSPQGALGPMQLLPSSFPNVNPYDPEEAIDAAAGYVAQGLKQYGDPVKALMYYHGGPDTKQWGPRTHNYPHVVAEYYGLLNASPQQQKPQIQEQSTTFDPNVWVTKNAEKFKLDGLTLDQNGVMVPYDKQGKLVYDAPGYDYEWAKKNAE